MMNMKKIISLILIFIFAVSLCSCTPTERHASLNAMDTFMEFTVYGGQPEWAAESVENKIRELDRLLSTTDTGDVGLLNKYGTARFCELSLEALSRSVELCGELDGALDITVYPLVEEWGFISGKYKIPSESEIKKLLSSVGFKKVEIDGDGVSLPKNTRIDLGAVAKGFLADKCVKTVRDEGSKSAIFKLGGTIAVYGKKTDGSDWKVAITDPDNTSEYFGYLSCKDTVVSTSGGYERYFEKNGKKYIHIIDPKTGYPVDNGIKSVSVISREGIYADALSTALCVMGVEKALDYYKAHKDFDFIILTDDNKMYISGGISDSFTLCDGYEYEIVKTD